MSDTSLPAKRRIRTMIVDDSVVFRSVLKAALAAIPEVEVRFIAANGSQALAKLASSSTATAGAAASAPVDLIILDLEMPEMDGLQTLAALKAQGNTARKLIFAAPSSSQYRSVSTALSAGADDLLTKPIGVEGQDPAKIIEQIRSELVARLSALFPVSGAETGAAVRKLAAVPPPTKQTAAKRLVNAVEPKAIVIASSTGGPMALRKLFEPLRAPIQVPIFIVQHMPPPFTKGLAAEIGEITGVVTREAEDGEKVQNDRIYIAPADFHLSLIFDPLRRDIRLQVKTGEKINYVRPAADPLFSTAARIYGRQLVGFVLTGMGADGKQGACDVREAGGAVVIQDKASCVVWGMPGAVHAADAYDDIGDLVHCGGLLTRLVKRGS